MPSKFPWSKTKGSQASSVDHHQRSPSGQDIYVNSPPPAPAYSEDIPHHSQPAFVSQKLPPHPSSSRPPIRLQSPGEGARQAQSNPASPAAAFPSLRDQDSKKSFRERLGFTGSSRENLGETLDESSGKRDNLRRRLSARRKEPPTVQHQTSPSSSTSQRFVPQVSRQTPPLNKNAYSETEGLRDLAEFFRSTGPSSRSRRPVSVIGGQYSHLSSWNDQGLAEPPVSGPTPPSSSLGPQAAQGSTARAVQEEEEVDDDDSIFDDFKGRSQFRAHLRDAPNQRFDPSQGPKPLVPALRRPVEQGQSAESPIAPSRSDSRLQTYLEDDSTRGYHVQTDDEIPPQAQQITIFSSRTRNDSLFFNSNRLQPHPTGYRPPTRGSIDSNEDNVSPAMAGKNHPVPSPALARQQTEHSNTGRRTPPPGKTAKDLSEQETNQLIESYRELREKYSKVKRYYFEKENQVTQLQNAVAHQRLSQLRTSLDDGEYVTRLTRLDGLIAQLAFGFRKDWKSIPSWLQLAVNKDAVTTGKQEMTAVGRAFMSRWLVDEVFGKHFHPNLRPDVSISLKSVQNQIRRNSPQLSTEEEEEALTDKIINWRLATIEGLQQELNSPEAAKRRQALTENLNRELVQALLNHMQEPPPAGIEGGVNMIIELVVSILSHLPYESRDVAIDYYPPGTVINQDLMKIETGTIAPLSDPICVELPADDEDSSVPSHKNSIDSRGEEDEPVKEQEPTRKGLLGSLMGSKKAGNQSVKQPTGTESQSSLAQKEEQPARVRVCVLPGLQIRGKMVLAKAPVYKS